MGGQPSSQTVTNRTEVDPVTQAWRANIMGAGGQLYNQGVPAYYPGATVTPFSDQTQSGLNYLEQYASQGRPANLDAANAASGRALSGWNPALPYAQSYAGGSNPLMQGVLNASQQGVAGQVSPMLQGGAAENPWASQIANAGARPTSAGLDQLRGFASGQNPYLDRMFTRGAEQVSNAVNSNFAQAGRFGPNAAHTGALTQGIGDLYSNIYAPAYESGQSRALQAASMLPQIEQADRSAAMQGYGQAGSLFESGAGRGLQGAGLYGGLATSDANRALQGAGTAAGYGLEGAGLYGGTYAQGNADAARTQALLPGLYNYGMMPGQSMLDVGGMYEGQAQNYLDADRARYDYTANAPWDYLQRYSSMMNGLPDFSGTTQTTTGPRPNRLMQGLGAASTAASLFSIFSDRRLKRDIRHIGEHNGIPWYAYRYFWDAPGTVRYGVMADEAPPHAVSMHPSGYLMVNYGAL